MGLHCNGTAGQNEPIPFAELGSAVENVTAYLAETDDDREWVPNPKQQSHPMPLPVDAARIGALERTWTTTGLFQA